MDKKIKEATVEKRYSANPVITPDDDLLGFKRYCLPTLVDIIEERGTPYVIGVYGPGGSGKTSLLHLTKQALEERGHQTIWIEPRKYNRAGDIKKALVSSVYTDLRTRIQIKTLSQQLRETGTLSAEALDGLSQAGNPPTEIERLFSMGPTLKDSFEAKFTFLLNQLLEEGKRLVIFMDDLDRCSPEVVMEATNAIKLYLDMPRSVFVISASSQVTEGAARHHQGECVPKEARPAEENADEKEEKNEGRDCPRRACREYLEEIVELPFPLPEPERQDLEELIVGNARKLGLKEDYRGWRQDLVNIVIAAAGSNPADVKRLLASTHLCSRMAEAKGKKLKGETQLKVAKVCAMTFGLSDSELRALLRCPKLAWPTSAEGQSYQSLDSRSEKTRPQWGHGIGNRLSIQQLWKLEPRIESIEEFEELLRLTSGSTGLTTVLSDEEELLNLMLKDDERIPEALAREIEGFEEGVEDYLNFFSYLVQSPEAEAIVKANSASVLGRLKQSRPEVVAALVSALQDGSQRVRVSAAYALGELGQYPPETIKALIPALRNEDPASHSRAVAALDQSGPPSPEGKTVLVYTPQKEESKLRSDLPEPPLKPAELSPDASDGPFSVSGDESSEAGREEAGVPRPEQPSPEAIGARLSFLKQESPSAQEPSAQSMSTSEESSRDPVRTLILALENSNLDVRMNAATDLGEFGQASPEIMSALTSALKDRNGSVRWRASMAIRKLGQAAPQETMRYLQDELGREEDLKLKERIQSVINDLTEN